MNTYLILNNSTILFGEDILKGEWTLIIISPETYDHLIEDCDTECDTIPF